MFSWRGLLSNTSPLAAHGSQQMTNGMEIPASDRLRKRRWRIRPLAFGVAGLCLLIVTLAGLYAVGRGERQIMLGSTTIEFKFEADAELKGFFQRDTWDGPTGSFQKGEDIQLKVPRGVFHIEVTRDPLGAVLKRLPEDVFELTKALKSKDPVVVQAAAEKLGDMGGEALPALPRLVQLIEQRQLTAWNPIELIALSSPKAAVPHLLKGVQASDTNAAVRFAQIIGNLGSNAVPAASGLMKLFASTPPPQSIEVAAAIWNITAECAELLPPLVRILEGPPDPHTQGFCLHVLGSFGKCAEPAVPQILSVLQTNAPGAIAARACGALGRIGARPDLCIPALKKVLASRQDQQLDGMARGAAINALAGFGTNGIPHLVALARGTNRLEREGAIRALIKSGPDSTEACEFFFDELSSNHLRHRALACEFFAVVGLEGRLALPKLRELLGHKAGTVRGSAAFALISQGEVTEDAVKELAANFNHIQTGIGGRSLLNQTAEEHPEFVPLIEATLRQSGYGPMIRRYGMFPALNKTKSE